VHKMTDIKNLSNPDQKKEEPTKLNIIIDKLALDTTLAQIEDELQEKKLEFSKIEMLNKIEIAKLSV
jgi:hypothetical protein